MQMLQQRLVVAKPELKQSLVSLEKLHLTLFVCLFSSTEEINKAAAVLTDCNLESPALSSNQHTGAPPTADIRLTFSGVGAFRHHVLVTNLKDDDGLASMATLRCTLLHELRLHGLGHTLIENKNPANDGKWNPHLTIAKVSKLPPKLKSRARLRTSLLVDKDYSAKSQDNRPSNVGNYVRDEQVEGSVRLMDGTGDKERSNEFGSGVSNADGITTSDAPIDTITMATTGQLKEQSGTAAQSACADGASTRRQNTPSASSLSASTTELECLLIGSQLVNSIQLCPMQSTNIDDHYYPVVAERCLT